MKLQVGNKYHLNNHANFIVEILSISKRKKKIDFIVLYHPWNKSLENKIVRYFHIPVFERTFKEYPDIKYKLLYG